MKLAWSLAKRFISTLLRKKGGCIHLEEEKNISNFHSPFRNFRVNFHQGYFHIHSINNFSMMELGRFNWTYERRERNEVILREILNTDFNANIKSLLVEIGITETELRDFICYLYRGTVPGQPHLYFHTLFFSCTDGKPNFDWSYSPLPQESA